MRLRYTQDALTHLADIHRYIAEQNPLIDERRSSHHRRLARAFGRHAP